MDPSLSHSPLITPTSPDGPAAVVTPIDFAVSPLAEDYSSFFAMTIDNLLTRDECAKLQGAAGMKEVKALRKGDKLAEIVAGPSHLKASIGAKKTVWRIKEANERLSFLHYQPGHHFKPHCDALYARPGKDERSFLTCQIYLNDAPEDMNGDSGGGETRFWASQAGKRQKTIETEHEMEDKKEAPFLDIKPKEVRHGEKFTVRLDLMFERHFEKL
ncbi:hypothetical protein EKO27_g2516 [Xylaria grammica]|uniref:Prolyl 4-hydroxylase alpha subunit Fe(2+) 2OG dioxygenase domain-containing protein n=1 Tax=Xylaria grammica TaxID=363999 RepID=A0A439DDY6_9PEZI|nr:hypothetical protein EKO27_g2516 [Xylaria grammica]